MKTKLSGRQLHALIVLGKKEPLNECFWICTLYLVMRRSCLVVQEMQCAYVHMYMMVIKLVEEAGNGTAGLQWINVQRCEKVAVIRSRQHRAAGIACNGPYSVSPYQQYISPSKRNVLYFCYLNNLNLIYCTNANGDVHQYPNGK